MKLNNEYVRSLNTIIINNWGEIIMSKKIYTILFSISIISADSLDVFFKGAIQ